MPCLNGLVHGVCHSHISSATSIISLKSLHVSDRGGKHAGARHVLIDEGFGFRGDDRYTT